MLGWGIYIYQRRPGQSIEEAAAKENEDKNLLAWWITGYKGTEWLDKLAEEGKAESLGGNGYPFRYTTIARNVLPQIELGPPAEKTSPVIGEDYSLPKNWGGKATIYRERIRQCGSDEELVIEAWDQS